MNALMSEIDGYSDVLSPELRAAWPVVASATRKLNGSLVGGTALALTLRHRESFDLDFLVYEEFSGANLFRKLSRQTDLPCDLVQAETDSMHARVGGIVVQVFRQPFRGDNPGFAQQLQKPAVIDGMRVASLPDLLATKLDVIMYRPKLRDYIDIAAIDKSGWYGIEDGLRFHATRYGVPSHSSTPAKIVRLLEQPGRLAPDRVFADVEEETLNYLHTRALGVQAVLGSLRVITASIPQDDGAHFLSVGARRKQRCGAWMRVARAYCSLPKGHSGHHRSK